MSRSSNLHGILIMLLAVAVFALMDAGLKLLTPHYPAMQVAALRGLASIPFVLVWVFATVGARSLLRVRWPLHLLRGVIAVTMMGTFVYALGIMPLSTAYTIFFVAPLIITALSVPILGERVGPRRWTAIVVGLIGVLVVLRPSGEGLLSLAGLAVFGSAIGYAVSAITVRVLSRTDSTQSMVFWMVTLAELDSHSPCRLGADRRHRRGRCARAVRHHRSLLARRGLGGRALRVHRVGLGSAARPRAVGRAAGPDHLDRRRHHHYQRAVPDPARA
jgi:multidrug transporter EmrE-like cation transporter